MPTEPQAAETLDALRARTEAQRCPDCGLGNDLDHFGCITSAATTQPAIEISNETNVLEVVETHLPATSTPPLPAAPIGPLSVQPLQWDHGASIAICHPQRGVIASIEPTNTDDDPDMHTAKREPWDASYAFLFAAAPQMLEALKAYEALDAQRSTCEECEHRLEYAPESCGNCCPFAMRARDLMRAAIAAAAPVADSQIGRWWEGAAIEGDDEPRVSGEDLTECQNCATIQPEGALNEIQDFDQRVEPGEAVPVGECPGCGSLCHPVAKAVQA